MDAVMNDGLADLTVFGERGDGLHGDSGIALGLGQHKARRACRRA